MHFGVFVEELRRGNSQVAWFEEAFDLVDMAEAWGVDCVWLGQIHFNPARSVLSASLVMASSIAARTQRLRVGTAIQILPLNHPLRIAEEVATVDQISKGRFEFGIGRSGAPRAYDVLGVPYAESQARFREALEIIREAWKGEPFSYKGEFYQVPTTTVTPRPYQLPHPPMRMAATTAETFPAVGHMGLPVFVGLRATQLSELRVQLESYREAWRDAGHAGQPSAYLRIPVYVAPTEKEAREDPHETITTFFKRQAELALSAVGRAGAGPADRRRAQAERMFNLTYEDILRTKVAFGTPARVIERLEELREDLGLDGFVAELNSGGLLPHELETRSLRLLAHDVIPTFR